MAKWKNVPGWEGLYEVSDKGEIRSWYYGVKRYEKPVIRKQKIDKDGYLVFTFNHKGVKRTIAVHRIVALVFIPNPNALPQVNHIDGNKQNNCVENLEWCSAKDNIRHAYERGLISKQKQSESQTKRYSDPEQREISRKNALKAYENPELRLKMQQKRSDPEYRKGLSERRKQQKPPTLGKVFINNGVIEKFVDKETAENLSEPWVRGRLKHERREKRGRRQLDITK